MAGKIKNPLPTTNTGISIITEIETLAYPLLTKKDEMQIKSIFENITIIPISDDIKEQTIIYRKQHKIKLPDAIICATCYVMGATLLTCDKQLLKLKNITHQKIELIS
ncbi:MAG: type II toxin-antitoxin system VapC family toxin [Gammaproteobacteria bacterium]|nr:MAG: type II toxin-antitoxin system VapC family toxin [Gammaproteobacteria bacterium]